MIINSAIYGGGSPTPVEPLPEWWEVDLPEGLRDQTLYYNFVKNGDVLISGEDTSTGIYLLSKTTKQFTYAYQFGSFNTFQNIGEDCIISSTSAHENSSGILVYRNGVISKEYSTGYGWVVQKIIDNEVAFISGTSSVNTVGLLMYKNGILSTRVLTGYNWNIYIEFQNQWFISCNISTGVGVYRFTNTNPISFTQVWDKNYKFDSSYNDANTFLLSPSGTSIYGGIISWENGQFVWRYSSGYGWKYFYKDIVGNVLIGSYNASNGVLLYEPLINAIYPVSGVGSITEFLPLDNGKIICFGGTPTGARSEDGYRGVVVYDTSTKLAEAIPGTITTTRAIPTTNGVLFYASNSSWGSPGIRGLCFYDTTLNTLTHLRYDTDGGFNIPEPYIQNVNNDFYMAFASTSFQAVLFYFNGSTNVLTNIATGVLGNSSTIKIFDDGEMVYEHYLSASNRYPKRVKNGVITDMGTLTLAKLYEYGDYLVLSTANNISVYNNIAKTFTQVLSYTASQAHGAGTTLYVGTSSSGARGIYSINLTTNALTQETALGYNWAKVITNNGAMLISTTANFMHYFIKNSDASIIEITPPIGYERYRITFIGNIDDKYFLCYPNGATNSTTFIGILQFNDDTMNYTLLTPYGSGLNINGIIQVNSNIYFVGTNYVYNYNTNRYEDILAATTRFGYYFLGNSYVTDIRTKQTKTLAGYYTTITQELDKYRFATLSGTGKVLYGEEL